MKLSPDALNVIGRLIYIEFARNVLLSFLVL
jgi:hypothetical protein